MNLLSLLCSCGLACSDSPYRLVSDNDILHVLSSEVLEDIDSLSLANSEMLVCLSLLEVLTHAEDNFQTCCKSKFGLFNKLLVSLTIILAALRVAENSVFATN